jgi:hypothetical protein
MDNVVNKDLLLMQLRDLKRAHKVESTIAYPSSDKVFITLRWNERQHEHTHTFSVAGDFRQMLKQPFNLNI